ncbi:MAG: GNAT family N-acetyltransferase [Candidatus Heimdallarchaeota archaeon]|nr:GNAT family N-acetyltransferase [Candidatus Heimdallarchaeota archaeon]
MFEDNLVRLRSFELTDLDSMMEHWNDLSLRRFCGRINPDSREERKEFIINSWKLRQEGKNFFFAIEEKEMKRFLGHTNLTIINKIACSASLGIFIYYEKDWNKGYGYDTMIILLKFGFDFLNLHRIELSVYPYNERAIHVYEKIGFTIFGRKRQSRFMNGQYQDEILMDILVDEWRNITSTKC